MKPAPSPEVLAADNQRLRQALAEATARAEGLATQAEALTAQAEALAAQIRELEAIRRDLEHQVALFKRCLFGSRSEKVSAEELEARIRQHAQEAREAIAQEKGPGDPPPEAEEERPEEPEKGGPPPESTPAGKPPKRQARPHGRTPLPAHLPRRRIEHPIDPAQTTCPHCADHPPMVKIGEDIREKLHKLPVLYEVHQHIYPKCACPRCHFGVVMPEGPDHGLKADITVVADVVVQKYAEHKPLYAKNQWPAMARYLEVPQAEIDNNSIEHALRGVVMGRKNWLHVGQEAGGERAANLFSLMISCQRLGVEPYAYLCDIVPRLSHHPQRDIWQLTPRGWRDSRASPPVPTAPSG